MSTLRTTMAVLLWSLASIVPASEQQPSSPALLLITLDTTRADALGSYGNPQAETPHLDRLAAQGVRFARAVSPSPLTLPAHASLLTGLAPPEHGIHDNGLAALSSEIPTLASELSQHGYANVAVVASKVLDRRFRLDRGFAIYDDRMAAERLGEYGYPERDAAAVTDSALAHLEALSDEQPGFLWVHYYDPHAPYQSPVRPPGGSPSPHQEYAAEVAFVDLHIGRLLEAWNRKYERSVIAVVGDHGESLGEHGERTHGLFLYRAALEVPLIITAPDLDPAVIGEVVSTRRIAPTLFDLLNIDKRGDFGRPLPGFGVAVGPQPAYSETWMPATAYGWSALSAFTDQRWRFIAAPREELYDIDSDPREQHNLTKSEPDIAARLRTQLETYRSSFVDRSSDSSQADLDPELIESLRSLGYLSGSTAPQPRAGSNRDPKDGLALLDELERANAFWRTGNLHGALEILESLVERDPGNVPFTSRLAAALFAAGHSERALETYQLVISLNPDLDFSHLHYGHALHQLGQIEKAQNAYRRVIELNPRFAAAWLALAEIERDAGRSSGETELLKQALASGTTSAGISLRLAQIWRSSGDQDKATRSASTATELLPTWDLAWFVRAKCELDQGKIAPATDALERVIKLSPGSRLATQAHSILSSLRSSASTPPD